LPQRIFWGLAGPVVYGGIGYAIAKGCEAENPWKVAGIVAGTIGAYAGLFMFTGGCTGWEDHPGELDDFWYEN